MAENPTEPKFVAVGRLLKPHGLKGDVKVETLTPDPERLIALKRVFATSQFGDRRALEIESGRLVADGVLIKFKGFDAPEPLNEFNGWTLEIPRSEARKPPPGETLYADMIGLLAVDADSGVEIGEIRAIVTAGNDLLEIATPTGDLLIPWVPEFVVGVDLTKRQVKIKAIPGLLEP